MSALKSLRVLLAEDESPWQHKIRKVLEQSGHTVEVVSSYAEAFAKFTAEAFDLTIVDLRLGPDIDNRDGVFLLEDAFAKGIPAIVITGHGTRDMIKQANRHDALRLMHKGSFDIAEFKQIVDVIARTTAPDSHSPTPRETENVKELLRRLAAGKPI